jgi:soluble lytic murein transglycosylase-like protein
MGYGIIALILAGIAAYFIVPSSAIASTDSGGVSLPTLDQIFQKWADAYGIDWKLAKAVAMNESSLNPYAVNSADNESLGLMQVLCRPDGNGGCTNTFNVDGWSDATRAKLLQSDFNVRIGTQILAWNIQTYGLPKGIAVYNKWNERDSPQEGPFDNQAYVDRVYANYRSLA